MQPYAPRPIRFDGIQTPDVSSGWRLKRYDIWHGDAVFDAGRFEAGTALALAELPAPAVTEMRPGVGFLVAHQGSGMDYLVLGWWDRENELPLRVFVRADDGGTWRPAHGSESVCVWDLQVIAHERDAYVETVLGGGTVAAYLERVLNVKPSPAYSKFQGN